MPPTSSSPDTGASAYPAESRSVEWNRLTGRDDRPAPSAGADVLFGTGAFAAVPPRPPDPTTSGVAEPPRLPRFGPDTSAPGATSGGRPSVGTTESGTRGDQAGRGSTMLSPRVLLWLVIVLAAALVAVSLFAIIIPAVTASSDPAVPSTSAEAVAESVSAHPVLARPLST